jgi:hypothetical protein
MLEFARKSEQERHAQFEKAGERLKIGAHIIEKDFWKYKSIVLPPAELKTEALPKTAPRSGAEQNEGNKYARR